MPGTLERPEGVYGRVRQDPRDMVNADLREAQFPAVKRPHSLTTTLGAGPLDRSAA